MQNHGRTTGGLARHRRGGTWPFSARRALGMMVVLGLAPGPATAETFAYPPVMDGARAATYKTVGETELRLYVFPAEPPATNRPGIIFFFGGGWTFGSPSQFAPQCRYLAARGMVAMAADYRVGSRNNVKPVQCLADARSAIRWVRAHAGELGVDPQRIAAGGGSAGGHLAACTPFIAEFDEPGEDQAVSAAPNALVLFNPGLVLAPLPDYRPRGFGATLSQDRLGTSADRISPAHHVGAHAPPTIIFHGRADETVPYDSAQAFTDVMRTFGNRCELHGYDGQPHGFFNRAPFQAQTIEEADRFLVSLGWLTDPHAPPRQRAPARDDG